MLQDISYLDHALSQGELVSKILHQEIPCTLLRVVFPAGEDGDRPHGYAYLDFGDPDRLLRLQPGTYVSSYSSRVSSGTLEANGPVFLRLVERADAVTQTVMAVEVWTDDDDDASSHPIAWGVYLALLRNSGMRVRIPEGGQVEHYHFDTLGSVAGNISLTVKT